MSIMKFLRILLNESGMEGMYQFAPGERHVELVAAQSQVASLVAAYDALAPDWSQAPDGAEWYTIDAENQCYRHIDEPSLFDATWDSNGMDWAGFTDVPLGVDWRLLKWQRPEVAA